MHIIVRCDIVFFIETLLNTECWHFFTRFNLIIVHHLAKKTLIHHVVRELKLQNKNGTFEKAKREKERKKILESLLDWRVKKKIIREKG